MTNSSKRYVTDGFKLPPNYAALPKDTAFMMLNDCEVCGYDQNFSTDQTCLKCATPINPTRNYLPDEPELLPQDYLQFLESGEDKVICQHLVGNSGIKCQRINPASIEKCLFCDADLNQFGVPYVKATFGSVETYIAPNSEYSTIQPRSKLNQAKESSHESPKSHFEFPDMPSWVIPATLSALIFGLITFLFWLFILKTSPVMLKVYRLNWVRNIPIEEKTPKTFSGFKTDAPSEAFTTGTITYSQQRPTGATKNVVVGKKPGKVKLETQEEDGFEYKDIPVPAKASTYDCGKVDGKGVFRAKTCPTTIPQPPNKKKVTKYKTVTTWIDGMVDDIEVQPIKAEYVTINYYRWETISQITTSGNDNKPYCGPRPTVFGYNQRIGDCTGINTVSFQIIDQSSKEQKTAFLNVSDLDFSTFKVGQSYTADINKIGGLSNLLLTSGK